MSNAEGTGEAGQHFANPVEVSSSQVSIFDAYPLSGSGFSASSSVPHFLIAEGCLAFGHLLSAHH